MKLPFLVIALGASLLAQTEPRQVTAVLSRPSLTPDVVAHEIQQYLMKKTPAFSYSSGEAGRLRQRVLDEVVFHGWPKEWVIAPPRFEDLGAIASTDKGYRMRKLRYEIVPGFWSTAILYEPENLTGRVPAVLNVNGHVGAPGKSVEYKQKRCIQIARMGMMALNLEWVGMGESTTPANVHWNLAHLDLVGANGLGLMYLAMRKGLDYLEAHPNVDRTKLAVTGLSGGGWQTIVLSALDERVAVAIPVAGYCDMTLRIARPLDTGDYEQNATDLLTIADYPELTAMRAPRPTLLVYNAEDDCCFRAPLVKPALYDANRRFFPEGRLAWHENLDPADHNYQYDNRMAAYRFLGQHFGVRAPEREVPAELLSYEQMTVGLPADNLTIVGLARKMAASRQEGGSLKDLLRYQPVALTRAWPQFNTKSKGLETAHFRLEFANGLSATAVWLHAIDAAPNGRVTVVLNDKGKAASGAEVSNLVNRGDHVIAADLLLFGDAAPAKPDPYHYSQMFTAMGDRPLAIQAAQLLALAAWARQQTGAKEVRVETSGIRTQMVALAAAALQNGAFSEIISRQGMNSLGYVLDKSVEFTAAPELFVLDLYKSTDIKTLIRSAAPTRVSVTESN